MIETDYILVAVPDAGNRILTYSCPEDILAENLVGFRVLVPVGKRSSVGVVIGIESNLPEGVEVKEIHDIIDIKPSIPNDILILTRFVAEYYLCTWSDVLKASLPGGLMRPPQINIKWIGPELEGLWPAEVQNNKTLRKIARFLSGVNQVDISKVAKNTVKTGIRQKIRYLERLELIEAHEKLAVDAASTLTKEIVHLDKNVNIENIPKRYKARIRLLEYLVKFEGKVEWNILRDEANIPRSVLNDLENDNIVKIERVSKDIGFTGFDPRAGEPEPELSADQTLAVRGIRKLINEPDAKKVALLTAPPGGGKTRVYIEILREIVMQDRGAILLVPEIALTPQVVARIKNSIDAPVAVLHSNMTPQQRVASWREVLAGNIKLVVGPRSAIFAPVKNLGLIIIDEEHEESYKQVDPIPRYHGRDVALMRGKIANAAVVMVSATPSLEAMRLVEAGDAIQYQLKGRFGAGWPEIQIVDRRREEKDAPYIGPLLEREIEDRLAKNEGIVLLITRRGFAPVLLCTECNWRAKCENCDVSLTYHSMGTRKTLRCHMCGYKREVPETCDECNSRELQIAGAGTQRIEDEIFRRFPDIRPVRMDRDTAKKSGDHEKILRSFSEGDAQLLLGTQMVAKGHDFEHVTLVGVINADPSLMMPDFRASERTFRLLVQAAGRAGRGKKAGLVIIQTLAPDNSVFKAISGIKEPNIEDFLRSEAERRRIYNYPPYARMILLTVSSDKNELAAKYSEQLGTILRKIDKRIIINGPVQALIAKVKRRYRWRISLRTSRIDDPNGMLLRAAVKEAVSQISLSYNVHLSIDVDPLEVV